MIEHDEPHLFKGIYLLRKCEQLQFQLVALVLIPLLRHVRETMTNGKYPWQSVTHIS